MFGWITQNPLVNWGRMLNARADAERRFWALEGRMLERVESLSDPELAEEDPRLTNDLMLANWPKAKDRDFTPDQLRYAARNLYEDNPYACNIIEQLVNFVIGEGMLFEVEPADGFEDAVTDDDIQIGQTVWNEFTDGNEWLLRQWEWVRRAWRDGETFARLFDPGSEWPPRLRFVDPECIGPPSGQATPTFGILTDPKDVEDVVHYQLINPETQAPDGTVPAANMVHTKIGVDLNVKRGRTALRPVVKKLLRYGGWEDTELVARKLQASAVMHRIHKGATPSSLGSFADGMKTSTTSFPEGDIRRTKTRMGSVYDTSDQTEIKMLSPNTNFRDGAPLGRMIVLSIAAGVQFPEFLLTSDASNSNYASTLVAEGPVVRAFKRHQAFFGTAMWASELWPRLVKMAVKTNRLTEAQAAGLTLKVTGQRVEHRDMQKLVDSLDKAANHDAVSGQQISRELGYDPERMQQEIADGMTESPVADIRAQRQQDLAKQMAATQPPAVEPADDD